MADTTRQVNEIGNFFETLVEMTKTFWPDMGVERKEMFDGAGLKFNFDSTGDSEADDDKHKTYKTWEGSVNNFTSFLKIMTTPENQEQLTKSFMTFTEALTQATGDSLENFIEFQGRMVKGFAKVGEHTKAYNLDDIDHGAFESFRELYRSELQTFFQIPKFGLPREFHEHLSQLTDKSNIFSSYLIELLYLFTLPFEKTNRLMQKKLKRMFESGEFVDDSKQVYNDWIKVLEGQFAELLKSKEYTDVLNKTITSLAAYKGVKTDVTNVFLKEMQIPTSREMDDIYKELYQMKKKIKELNQKVARLQDERKDACV